jgi:hypothetical protein
MANTYPTTQFPLGSTEVKVLFNNASNFDEAMNSELPSFYDRFNKRRETWAGMQKMVADFIEAFGWEATHLTYVDGTPLTVLRPTQLIDRAGSVYKVKMPASFPVNLTGTWATDQLLLVDVGDASLRSTLASSAGSGMVGWDVNQAYAVGTVGYELLASLPAFINARAYGVKGDGVTDDTLAIQAARDSGFPILFSAGTFMLSLAQNITLEGGASVCAIKGKCVFRGAGMGRTIFKLKDNESTDASPKYFNIIAINTIVDGLLLEGITFDINGQNNLISPNRGGLIYNQFNCAALMVSGSLATVGVDARLVNSKILQCEVINSPGVTCIALGQSNTNSGGGGTGAVLGNNVEIAGCRFYNNGLDANDHSSVYMWCNGVWVHHCTFDHPVMSSGVQGPLAAAELHGSACRFTDNTVNNYLWGVYVAGNYTSVSRGQFVLNNQFFVAQKAVIIFNETALEPGMADVNIHGNTVWLTNDFQHGGGEAKRCFDLVPSQGQVDGLLVSGNILFTTDLYGAIAIRVGALAATKSVRNVLLSANIIKGFGTPIQFGVTGGGLVDDIKISNNLLGDVKPNTTAPVFTIGIYGVGANGTVDISGNKGVGTTTAHPYYGVFLDTGTMSNLHMSDNVFDAGTTVPVQDSVIVVGRRSGRQALSFSALPTQSTWRVGDEIYDPNLVEAGVAASKYVRRGWLRLTNGTGNVAITDWVESRVLTGN